MIKKLVKIVLSILFIFTICLLYLSYYGIETKRFNQLIKDKITKINHATNIDLKEVKIILSKYFWICFLILIFIFDDDVKECS